MNETRTRGRVRKSHADFAHEVKRSEDRVQGKMRQRKSSVDIRQMTVGASEESVESRLGRLKIIDFFKMLLKNCKDWCFMIRYFCLRHIEREDSIYGFEI